MQGRSKTSKIRLKTIKKYAKKIGDNSTIYYVPDFLSQSASKKLYKSLLIDIEWEHGYYNMYGKQIATPRLLAAMRDENDDITDSYTVTDSIPWTKKIKKIKKEIEKITGKKIRYAQLNYYRDGNDYIGYHTDSEVRPGDFIASISLGAPRKFVLRHKQYKTRDGNNKHEMILQDGSLLIMDENSAKNNWKHTITKTKKVHKGRINITFRPE